MVQGSGGLGFLDKTGLGLGVFGQLTRQKLEGDRPLELRVLGLVHDAHPAFPEFLEDSVVSDRLPDHPFTPCSLQIKDISFFPKPQ